VRYLLGLIFFLVLCGGVHAQSISPAFYAFGNVTLGSSLTSTSLTVTNNSGSTITFSALSYTGTNSGDFTTASNACTGTLTNTSSCVITVTFAPTATSGTGETASLSIPYTGASGSPLTISLTGTSIGGTIATPTCAPAGGSVPNSASCSGPNITYNLTASLVSSTMNYSLSSNSSSWPLTSTFSIPQNPTPDVVDAGFAFQINNNHITNLIINGNSSSDYLVFYNIAGGGAFASFVNSSTTTFALGGAQLYSGSESSPTMLAGTYTLTQFVPVTLCYTLNGSTPTAPTPGTCGAGSTTYTGAITISVAGQLKILATYAGYINSAVQTYTFTSGGITPIAKLIGNAILKGLVVIP